MVSTFQFVYMVYHIDWFACIEEYWHHCDKSHLIMVCYCCSVTSCFQLFAILWTTAQQASMSLTNSRSLPKFMFIESVMSSSHLILWCPLLPLIFCSIRDFSLHQITEILEHQFLQVYIQGWSPLRLIGLISLLCNALSGVFSSRTAQRNQFFGILPSLKSISHNCTWSLGRPYGPLLAE